MSEESHNSDLNDAKRENDDQLGELDADAQKMDERLEKHESEAEAVEVPEPDYGDDLSISDPPGEDEPGVGEGDVPEGEGEAADKAGQ